MFSSKALIALAAIFSSAAYAQEKATFTRYGGCANQANACGPKPSPGFTAALSQAQFGNSYKGPACGTCYELTITGDTYKQVPTKTITVTIDNECPDQGNEQWCQVPNKYGAQIHFDLCEDSGAANAFFYQNGGTGIGTAQKVACGTSPSGNSTGSAGGSGGSGSGSGGSGSGGSGGSGYSPGSGGSSGGGGGGSTGGGSSGSGGSGSGSDSGSSSGGSGSGSGGSGYTPGSSGGSSGGSGSGSGGSSGSEGSGSSPSYGDTTPTPAAYYPPKQTGKSYKKWGAGGNKGYKARRDLYPGFGGYHAHAV